MERIAIFKNEWTCTSDENKHHDDITGKVLYTILGIIKDSLVMSVVVMMGAAVALLLG
jgi:hypothetical protein